MLLLGLAKTQHTRDDEGPYSCRNLAETTVILMSFQTFSSFDYVTQRYSHQIRTVNQIRRSYQNDQNDQSNIIV